MKKLIAITAVILASIITYIDYGMFEPHRFPIAEIGISAAAGILSGLAGAAIATGIMYMLSRKFD